MATKRTRLSAPTRSTGMQQPRQRRTHLPLKLPGGRRQGPSPVSALGPTPATAPLRKCCAAVEDVPSSSTGKCKKGMAAPPATKKVSAKEDGTGGTFTISATLDSK